MTSTTRSVLLLSSLAAVHFATMRTLHANEPAPPASVSQSDERFIRQAELGGVAEVEMARLAKKQGSSPRVKEFAERMIVDHQRANRKLEQIAAGRGITLSGAVDAEHKAKLDELAKESGEAFDRQYMTAQVAGHQKMQALLEDEAKGSQDQALRRFAAESLPTVEAHHRMAEDIQKNLTAPRASAAE